MDLHKAWQSFNKEAAAQIHLTTETMTEAVKKESQLPMTQLRKRLVTKSIFAAISVLLPIALLFYFKDPLFQVLVVSTLLLQLYFLLMLLLQIQQLKRISRTDGTLLQTLQAYYNNVRSILYLESIFGLLITPVACVTGALISYFSNHSDNTSIQALTNTSYTFIIGSVALISSPLGYWATKRMNSKAYGAYLEQLRNNIERLKAA